MSNIITTSHTASLVKHLPLQSHSHLNMSPVRCIIVCKCGLRSFSKSFSDLSSMHRSRSTETEFGSTFPLLIRTSVCEPIEVNDDDQNDNNVVGVDDEDD